MFVASQIQNVTTQISCTQNGLPSVVANWRNSQRLVIARGESVSGVTKAVGAATGEWGTDLRLSFYAGESVHQRQAHFAQIQFVLNAAKYFIIQTALIA